MAKVLFKKYEKWWDVCDTKVFECECCTQLYGHATNVYENSYTKDVELDADMPFLPFKSRQAAWDSIKQVAYLCNNCKKYMGEGLQKVDAALESACSELDKLDFCDMDGPQKPCVEDSTYDCVKCLKEFFKEQVSL